MSRWNSTVRRRELLQGIAGGLLTGRSLAHAQTAARPNILFVISDDLNNDFGLAHLAEVKTPNLDRVRDRSVRFVHNYCQYPLCNPSRVSIFSGLYPTTTQVLDNLTQPRSTIRDFVTLPQHLRSHGYQAAYFGKVFHLLDPMSWRDDAPPPQTARDKGFNYWIQPVGPKNRDVAASLASFNDPQTGALEQMDDYKIATQAIARMREFRQQDKPFFLAVGFRRPHVPLVAPQGFFDLYNPAKVTLPVDFQPMPGWRGHVPPDAFRPNLDLFYNRTATKDKARQLIAAYYGCVSLLDAQLGRILDELERLQIAGNTIVLVTADHGWHLGQKGMWAKMTLFEQSAAVPLLIADPRRKARDPCHAITESLNIYPTLAGLCGVPIPGGLEGQSLAPFLDDPARTWDRPARTVMVRPTCLGRSVRTAQWRYTEWDAGRRGAELYDHEHDPLELKNLAGEKKVKAVIENLRKNHLMAADER